MYKGRKIWNFITTVLVAVTVLLALALAGPRLFGYQVFTVLSGSMEPTFRTGSVIYVRPTETEGLEEGDVITFRAGEKLTATHRILRVTEDGEGIGYITKGDANDSEDGTTVRPEDVIGCPVFMIPLLGYFAAFIQQPPGNVIAILLALAILAMIVLPDLLTGKNSGPSKRRSHRRGGPWILIGNKGRKSK